MYIHININMYNIHIYMYTYTHIYIYIHDAHNHHNISGTISCGAAPAIIRQSHRQLRVTGPFAD